MKQKHIAKIIAGVLAVSMMASGMISANAQQVPISDISTEETTHDTTLDIITEAVTNTDVCETTTQLTEECATTFENDVEYTTISPEQTAASNDTLTEVESTTSQSGIDCTTTMPPEEEIFTTTTTTTGECADYMYSVVYQGLDEDGNAKLLRRVYSQDVPMTIPKGNLSTEYKIGQRLIIRFGSQNGAITYFYVSCLCGDLNNDDETNVADLITMANILVDKLDKNDYNFQQLDFNADGNFNSGDLVSFAKMLVQ